MKPLLVLLLPSILMAQSWALQTSSATASLRGVSAIDAKVVWASGSGGAVLRTLDGGLTWHAIPVSGAEKLDFRAIAAIDQNTAYVLSTGAGDKSKIFKTTDGGVHWTLQFTNPDPKGFLDCLAFWDGAHGIALGDPVDGHFVVLTTSDSGAHWNPQTTPAAVSGEGAFAASNTSLAVLGSDEVWFGTGGPGGARVFHSRDGGGTWSVNPTPIRNDNASAGIFSLALIDERHGMAVGGDYAKPAENAGNVAVTSDGGETWTAPPGRPAGFRSSVAYLSDRQAWIVTGTSGSDVSTDGGKSWRNFDKGNFNALTMLSSVAGWAVGPRGRIGAFLW